MTNESWDRVAIDAQSVDAPLSRATVLLILTVSPDVEALPVVCSVLNAIDDLVKTVSFRDLHAKLSCVVGIGRELWDRIDSTKRPRELRSFVSVRGPVHSAPSTPGDLLFHIRSDRRDLCFEFETILLEAFDSSVVVIDEVYGFRYFDSRDLLGFVDGTANPTGSDLSESALVGDEDSDFAGGSYVVVQKYLHDLAGWKKLATETQQTIIGRTKLDNTEIEDDDAPRKSHKSLATVEDENGNEHDILRDNLPFGRPGQGEYGTYFIGYTRHLWVIEKMLQRMFLGEPVGSYDRLLDFSKAQTGVTFFAPSHSALQRLSRSQMP